MEDTAPFTKYKFNMPIGSAIDTPAVFFADSIEEANHFILFQMQKENLFLFTLSALDYEWDKESERFKKVKETLMLSTINVKKQCRREIDFGLYPGNESGAFDYLDNDPDNQ